MSIYRYKARDNSGKRVSGTMEAGNKTELIEKLHKMGYMTTSVREGKGEEALMSLLERFARVRSDDMMIFYIQFSNMINSGIPILTALDILGKQTENKHLREAVGNVTRQVEAGMSLSQAFASDVRVFPLLFINMVKAGEVSGKLDTVLIRYSVFFEHQEDLKQKIKGAVFYPAILFTFGIAVTLFIVTFLIPQFAELYMKSGVKLPIPTLVVYKAGLAIKNYWYYMVIVTTLVIMWVRYYMGLPKGKVFFDKLILKIPVIGPLARKIAVARFSRTLSTLLGSGVPILQSLDITRDIIGNEILARVVDSARQYVEKGEKMSEPLKISGEFPQDLVQMVYVGEETGNVDGMLNKIADFYDMTTSYAIKKLTTIIEPLFLVVMGIMVGIIMASMLMPIFDMVKTIKH